MPKDSKLYKVMKADVNTYLNKDVGVLFSSLKKKVERQPKRKIERIKLNKSFLTIFIIVVFILGGLSGNFLISQIKMHFSRVMEALTTQPSASLSSPVVNVPKSIPEYSPSPVISQEQAVIEVVKQASPAVVSIIITKDIPVYETYYEELPDPFEEFFGPGHGFDIKVPKQRQKGTEKKKVGGGTGFIVSQDGLVLTNKHVVTDKEADYTVITNEGKRYSAKVLARDPFQDLAILKIERPANVDSQGQVLQEPFPVVKLGDSSTVQIGQTVVAIGYALGEFSNTVSVGVISGQGRTITASGGGISETLTDVLQTDAAINRGNSGGPLLNLRGEVIGVNVAMAQDAQSIGFAININKAKRDVEQVKAQGRIVYPLLGVRYTAITPELKEELGLPVDYGSLVAKGSAQEPAISPGSGAEKAGLKEGDIILEIDGVRIDSKNPLGDLIQEHNPGDTIILKVLRDGKEMTLSATLGELKSEE